MAVAADVTEKSQQDGYPLAGITILALISRSPGACSNRPAAGLQVTGFDCMPAEPHRRIMPAARLEIIEVQDWYEKEAIGLDGHFRADLTAVISCAPLAIW